ncbi:hypothetical protein EDB83DRAFT_2409996, partial [Lactarius deliciosus]
MVDHETGWSKGFGFVTFEDNSNDAQVVGKLGPILDEKQVCFTFSHMSSVAYLCLDRS